jgi:hypothetical protein
MRVFAAILCLSLAACHRTPKAYTLAPKGPSLLLTPPPSKPEIKHARSHPSQKKGCDVESGLFSVTWRGNTAQIAAKDETYLAPAEAPRPQPGTPGVTIAETAPRIFADSLANIDQFRQALEAKEEEGCLRGDEAPRLRQAMTEAFALPPNIAVYVRFGAYTRTGYFDLTPEFLLRLVGPPVASPDISYYAVTSVPKSDKMRITLVSGAGKSLAIPELSGYFRFLYTTGASAHNFFATVLGAVDRKTLHEATQQFLTGPENFCAKPGLGVFCQTVDRSVGMNAGFNVKINGKESFVRLGGSIGEAISDAQSGFGVIGQRRSIPKVQSVRRLYRGKPIAIRFDATSNAILGLVAMPGDEIAFLP